jgi:hypothetical protein
VWAAVSKSAHTPIGRLIQLRARNQIPTTIPNAFAWAVVEKHCSAVTTFDNMLKTPAIVDDMILCKESKLRVYLSRTADSPRELLTLLEDLLCKHLSYPHFLSSRPLLVQARYWDLVEDATDDEDSKLIVAANTEVEQKFYQLWTKDSSIRVSAHV